MSNYIDTNGKLHFIYNDDFEHLLPQGSVKISAQDADSLRTVIIKETTFEDIRKALQSAIDSKARELGFSGGNALMLYAGFDNPFQSIALRFATWEVAIWTDAGQYKSDVIALIKPMLTTEEAVSLIPNF